MGDKNSYSPSFGGCQAVSEIKRVGSSDDTIAPVPRKAFSEAGMWIYTQTRSPTSMHVPHLFLTWPVDKTHLSPGRA